MYHNHCRKREAGNFRRKIMNITTAWKNPTINSYRALVISEYFANRGDN